MSNSLGLEAAGLAGEYIGVESCIDLRNEEEFEAYERECERSYERLRRRKEADEEGDRRWRGERKEFPPPITCLTRTENQPSHMPWVMRRYHTADGRLVIREEKVRRHEYFRAHRADGRLTLQLIPLDGGIVDDSGCCVDDVEGCGGKSTDAVGDGELKAESAEDEVNDEEDEEDVDDEIGEKIGAGDGGMKSGSVIVSSVSTSALCISEGVNGGGFIGVGSSGSTSASLAAATGGGGGGGGGGKKYCYGFNSLRSSSASSLFDLQVPAIRPVIS